MGIHSLNYYIRKFCSKSIKTQHLKAFEGQTIVIDTSIYLYRFKGMGTIIVNMYIMCGLFKKYNITPIFVFDGTPPSEKHETIKKRILKKKEAEEKYNVMKNNLENRLTKYERNSIIDKMKELEKQFIRVKGYEIRKVKKFLKEYGIDYIIAEGEADMVCAKMVVDGKANACLSDDMDLFVYGCPVVLRHFDFKKQTVLTYNLTHILTAFDISLYNFKCLCILTGTDYSQGNNRKQFGYYYTLYKRFTNLEDTDFVNWLTCNNDNIIHVIKKNLALFDVNSIQIPPRIINNTIDMNALQNILAEDHFIFPPHID